MGLTEVGRLLKGLGKTIAEGWLQVLGTGAPRRVPEDSATRSNRQVAPDSQVSGCPAAVPSSPPGMESQGGQSRQQDAQQPHSAVPLDWPLMSRPQGVVFHLLVCARAPTTGDGKPALHCKTFQDRVCWVTGVSNKQKKKMEEILGFKLPCGRIQAV